MPVPIEVCGWSHGGRPVRSLVASRWLLVRLDGVQVAEVHTSRLVIRATPGRHTLLVEVNSPFHQEYVPPLEVTRIIQVENRAGPIDFAACPTRSSP